MSDSANDEGASGARPVNAGDADGSGRSRPAERHAALTIVPLFVRLALGAGFLSAVADRFGVWGPPGAGGVAWGSFARFLDYTAVLNPWAPAGWIPAVGWAVTVLEAAVGTALVVGFRTREASLAASGLLLAFGLGMTVGTGVKSALDASVLAAAGAALLLARETKRSGPAKPGVDALLRS